MLDLYDVIVCVDIQIMYFLTSKVFLQRPSFNYFVHSVGNPKSLLFEDFNLSNQIKLLSLWYVGGNILTFSSGYVWQIMHVEHIETNMVFISDGVRRW